MKQEYAPDIDPLAWVAPFTGARIETLVTDSNIRHKDVAPFTGARIETF